MDVAAVSFHLRVCCGSRLVLACEAVSLIHLVCGRLWFIWRWFRSFALCARGGFVSFLCVQFRASATHLKLGSLRVTYPCLNGAPMYTVSAKRPGGRSFSVRRMPTPPFRRSCRANGGIANGGLPLRRELRGRSYRSNNTSPRGAHSYGASYASPPGNGQRKNPPRMHRAETALGNAPGPYPERARGIPTLI